MDWDFPFPLGFWGNKSVLLYSPSTDEHPAVSVADALSENIFYCNTWNLYAKQQTELEDGYIVGFPDKFSFTPSPIDVSGDVSQKLLARGDGSPDYVTIRLYEHARHVWGGLANSDGDYAGDGLTYLRSSAFSPQFSLYTDVFGVFSRCQIDTIELSAEANQQTTVKYGVVAEHQWTEDAIATRDLLSTLGLSPNATEPMRQIFSHDCNIIVGDDQEAVATPFDMPAGATSDLMRGYSFGDTPIPPGRYLVKMSFKIQNNLKPNYTMSSTQNWFPDVRTPSHSDYVRRNLMAFKRFQENIWPRSYYASKQRSITAELTWITDAFPMEICQRISGAAATQMYDVGGTLAQSLKFQFGPIIIGIIDPVWNSPELQLIPDNKFLVTMKMAAASDGPLILQPTEDWT